MSAVNRKAHGGARNGSGRPKRPSKLLRVPVDLYEDVKRYRDRIDTKKQCYKK